MGVSMSWRCRMLFSCAFHVVGFSFLVACSGVKGGAVGFKVNVDQKGSMGGELARGFAIDLELLAGIRVLGVSASMDGIG